MFLCVRKGVLLRMHQTMHRAEIASTIKRKAHRFFKSVRFRNIDKGILFRSDTVSDFLILKIFEFSGLSNLYLIRL